MQANALWRGQSCLGTAILGNDSDAGRRDETRVLGTEPCTAAINRCIGFGKHLNLSDLSDTVSLETRDSNQFAMGCFDVLSVSVSLHPVCIVT